MKRSRSTAGSWAAAWFVAILLCAWSFARAVSPTMFEGSTWGQILLVCDEHQERHSAHDVAELYEPVSNRFAIRRPVIHKGRTGASATVIPVGPDAGRVLVVGGYNQKNGPLSSSEIYDPATNSFTRGPNLSIDLDDHTATVIGIGPRGGWILIAGLKKTYLYDPINNKFIAGPTMASARIDHTAIAISSGPDAGEILFAGGMEYSGTATELYDPIGNSFYSGPMMNSGRDRHTATELASGENRGKILLVGGWNEANRRKDITVAEPLASTELYDPISNSFARPGATATLKVARASHTATVISSGLNAGKVLIAGGQQDDQHPLSSTEIYDPATNSFSLGPTMHSPRAQHVAITIAAGSNKGRILIAAGVGIQCDKYGCVTAALSSTEIYDPATNAFSPGPSMSGAPGDATAVQLPQPPLM